jgi:F0F1-type ATP synthase membrane subunit c/vacuolar-type H+-ATPase subunit K
LDISPENWELLGRYLGAGIALGLGGIGAAVGMGISAQQANVAIMRQPEQQGALLRTMLIGQAVGGSPSIFALVVGLLILLVPGLGPGAEGGKLFAILVGAGISIGFGSFGSGLGCGWPGGAACDGVARNPRQASHVTSTMVIGQAVTQSPSIFATVISLLLMFYRLPGSGWGAAGIAIGAGLAMGVGGLVPGIGSGWTAGGAVDGLGRWPRSRTVTTRTMLVGQAVCQTPAIFGMLVAFIMMFTLRDLQASFVGFAKTFGAALSVGLGGVGPGIGSGLAGKSGCQVTAGRPEISALILRTMLVGQAVSQSTAIYGLVIALAVLFVV